MRDRKENCERPAKDPRKAREKNTKKICIFENKVVSL